MSNNLIRKGLAIGATVSLALAGLVGFAAPANAAGTVYLEPAEGTAYSVHVDTNFTLQAYFDDAAQLGAEKVKFKVVAGASGDITAESGTAYSAVTNRITTVLGAATYDATRNDFVGHGSTSVGPSKSFLTILPVKATTFSVTVQAWMDFNDDDKITAGEQASEVRTINFVQTSGIAATTVVGNYGLGDTSVTASIKTTPELNGAQMAGASAAVSGTITASLTNARSTRVHASTATVWDETNKEFDVTIALPALTPTAPTTADIDAATSGTTRVTVTKASHGLMTGDTIRVEGNASLAVTRTTVQSVTAANEFGYDASAIPTGVAATTLDAVRVVIGDNSYNVTPNFANSTALGSAVGAAVSSPVATYAGTEAPTTANQLVATRDSDGNDETVSVRLLTKSVTGTYTVYDKDDKTVGAGKPVRITVGLTNIAANNARVNGTLITATSGQVVSAVTDANGAVALTVTTTEGETAAEAIALTIVAEGVAATSETLTFNWVATEYRVVDLNDTADWSAVTTERAATAGGGYTFNLQVHDQWMQVVPATVATHIKATVSDRTVSTSYVALSAGKASVTVNDGGLTTGPAAVAFAIERLSGGVYSAATGAQNPGTINVNFYNQTDAVALNANGVSSAVLTSTITRTTTSAVNGAVSAAFAWSDSGQNKTTVTGSVTNSVSGAAKKGALVTISGPSNVLFEATAGVSAFGTLSYYDADGTINVDLFSNIAQTAVITVTSGGVSKTVSVTFVASDTAADIRTASIAAVKSIKAGRTATVVLKVADKFGNTVAVDNTAKITLTGVGYLTSYPVTLTKGTATVTLVTGAGDFGKSTITLVADGKTAATTDDLTVTGAIWVGPVANAVAGADAGRVTIEAYRAKGKRVNVFVGSKRVASYVSNKAEFSKSVKVKTGTRNVRVVIQGPSSDFRGVIVVK